MSDKKIIISAVILAALVIAGGWYVSKHPQQASIIGGSPSPSANSSVTQHGIFIGNPDAPVVMQEYTNFLCSACARFAQTAMPRIMDDYVKTGKVRLEVFIYPPQELSRAGLCANDQGKFKEYHDYVFAHQTEITKEDDIKNFAVNAGLDKAAFNACYDNADKFKDVYEKWYSEGQARGVEATPTFFINGQELIGAQDYTEFKKIIDQKLAK